MLIFGSFWRWLFHIWFFWCKKLYCEININLSFGSVSFIQVSFSSSPVPFLSGLVEVNFWCIPFFFFVLGQFKVHVVNPEELFALSVNPLLIKEDCLSIERLHKDLIIIIPYIVFSGLKSQVLINITLDVVFVSKKNTLTIIFLKKNIMRVPLSLLKKQIRKQGFLGLITKSSSVQYSWQ